MTVSQAKSTKNNEKCVTSRCLRDWCVIRPTMIEIFDNVSKVIETSHVKIVRSQMHRLRSTQCVANPSLSPIGTSLLSLYISEQFSLSFDVFYIYIVIIIKTWFWILIILWVRRYTRRNLTMNTTFFVANTHQVCESHDRNYLTIAIISRSQFVTEQKSLINATRSQ